MIKLTDFEEYLLINSHKKGCVVYALKFGDKYYVGASNDLCKRIYGHILSINGILNGGYKNSTLVNTYERIINHMKEQNIERIQFLCLLRCDSREIMFHVEALYINHFHLQGKSLNGKIPNLEKLNGTFIKI